MNECALRRPAALISLLLAVLLGACAPEPAGDPPLKGAPMGGPLALTDQNGRRVGDRDFADKYRLVYFGYTFCPDVCPVDLQVIGAGLRRFETSDAARAARVQPIFITIDPERDTPAVLRRYVAAFHPRLIGLTGSADEIAAVARAYRINYGRGPGPAGGYLMNHTRIAVLYGPDRLPLAIIPHDKGPDGVAAELDRWVR
ncbi:MAG TPA: SCO family protein [Allosphingosinicella sp.]|nr:SCO family protein [Allosphingosinicella sp.]